MKKVELLFTPEPFYNSDWDNQLPSLEDTKKHFLLFLDSYFEIGDILHKNYSNSMVNFETFLGKKGDFVKTMPVKEYEDLGNYYHVLKNYYGMLLNACRRRYNFWLNDILPAKYITDTKKKKRLTLTN